MTHAFSPLDGPEHVARRTARCTLGVSPHALFTVSAPLSSSSFAQEQNYPVSIHAAESEAETQLVKDGSGPMMESYRQRGIGWDPPCSSPIAYLNILGILNQSTAAGGFHFNGICGL